MKGEKKLERQSWETEKQSWKPFSEKKSNKKEKDRDKLLKRGTTKEMLQTHPQNWCLSLLYKIGFFKQITVLEQAMTIEIMTHNIMTLCLVVKLQHSALRLYCAGLYSFSLSFICFIRTFISVFYCFKNSFFSNTKQF